MANSKTKKIASVVVAAAMVGTSMPTAMLTQAETISDGKASFKLADDKGKSITVPSNSKLELYTSEDRKSVLEGSVSTNGDEISFTPKGSVESDTKYWVGIKVDGYDWFYSKKPVTFEELKTSTPSVSLNPEKATPAHGGKLTFTLTNDGTQLTSSNIEFKNDKGDKLNIPNVNGNDKEFDFSAFTEGDKVSYEVNLSGYKKATGTLVINPSQTNEDVTLDAITAVPLKTTNVDKVYGDEEFSLKDNVELPNDYKGATSFAIQSGTDVASVDADGKVKILKSGTAVIKVKADKTDIYDEANSVITVNVSKKNLGKISGGMVDWDKSTKNYDGSNELEVTGKLNSSSGIVGSDQIKIKAKAKLDSSSVGEQGSVLSDIVFEGADNYEVTPDIKYGPNVKVTPKEVKITPKDISVNYGSKDWKSLSKGEIPSKYKLTDLIDISPLNKEEQKSFDELNLDDYISVSVKKERYKVGQSSNKLTVKIKQENGGNFKFVLDSGKQSNMTVSPDSRSEKEIWDDVEIDEKASKNAHQRGDTTYIKSGGEVTLKTKKDALYDTVNVKTTSPDVTTSFGNKIKIPSSAVSGGVSGKFYLSNSNDSNTKTSELNIPDVFKIDNDAPTVEFTDGRKTYASIFNGGKTKFTDNDETVKFAKANSKSGYTMNVTTSDKDSGLKSLKYSVVKIKDDADAKLKVREAATADDTKWKSVENGEIKISGTEEGYYIVIVKAKDNVGNEAVYASNGTVIDTTNPTISVSGLSNDITYNNIDYSFDLLDPISKGVVTGIAKVDVVVKENGEVITSSKKNTNSFSLNAKDLYGVDDLRKFSDFDLAKKSKHIKATIDANSNNITVEITAYDKAGNKVSTNEVSGVKIDKTKAKVTAIYEDSDVKNDKYFTQNRKLKLNINDRNFNESSAKVHLTVDGVSEDYSIDQIRKGEVKGIKLISDKVDSNDSKVASEYTDDRNVQYLFEVGDEDKVSHTYDVNFSYEKNKEIVNADFGDSVAPHGFVIDKVAPETKIVFNNGKGEEVDVSKDEKSPTYDNKKMSASLVVEESNFDPKDVIVHVSSKNANGEDENKYTIDYEEAVKNGNWVTVGNTHTFVMNEFTKDSNYSLWFEYTDLAGNTSKTDTYYFTVDTTPPKGSITIQGANGSSVYNELSSTASFQHVSSGDFYVDNTASDETSGIASVQYYLYSPNVDAKGNFSVPTESELANVQWSDWTGQLVIQPNRQVVVYQRIVDKAGNVTYVNSSGAIISDNVAPNEASISIKSSESSNGIYSGDVSASIHAEEQVAGATYSGLNTVKVEVLNGSTVTQTQTYNVGSLQDRNKTFDTNLVVDSKLNNSNFVTIRVTTTDWAGNTSVSEKKLVIDITPPRIEVVYDNNEPKNGKYYNRPRTATIRVYERNFDPKGVNLSILGGNAQVSGWSIGSQAGISDDNVNTATITFAEDGDYSFTMSVTDLAGNRADYGKTDTFTIDKTAPKLNVSWDKELVNGKYVNSTRTATITVNEHNFDANGFTADIKAELQKHGITKPSVGSWSQSGDNHTTTITFADDGDYSFVLNYEDLAGNKSETYTENEFTIDKTTPEITIEGVEDKSSNKGDVNPVVKISDLNYDKEKTVLKLKGNRHKERVVNGSFEDFDNGTRISLDLFPKTEDVDDIYTLTAESTDKAGNVSTKTIVFSVNRFGSNYYLSDDTNAYVKKYYNKSEQDIVIHEVNADELQNQTVHVVKNGETVNLNSDDYTIEDTSDSKGWKEYVYTVKAHVFKDEGQYEVSVDSEDKAGNKQSNQIKDKPASFIVDKTKPSSVITGVENKEIYNSQTREITISVSDNYETGDAELLINGKVVKKFSTSDVQKSNGKLKYTLDESPKWQKLEVRSTDAAGNESVSEGVNVLITSNALVRTVNNSWVKYGFGSLIVLFAVAFGLIFNHKKKEKQDSKK